RRQMHGRPRHCLAKRRAARADVRLVRPGQAGNVWYMGEDSLERTNGRFVRASDSWQAGVHGAKPGVIMRGRPRTGAVYRQEYYPPGALDQARVLGFLTSMHVSAGAVCKPLAAVGWGPRRAPPRAEDHLAR